MQDRLEGALTTRAVLIQSRDACTRQMLMQLILYPFRTGSQELNIVAPALRTLLRNLYSESAVMTQHSPVSAVMRQGDRTVLAQEPFTAGATNHKAREPTPDQQQHGLLTRLETRAHLVEQLSREGTLPIRLQELEPHINVFL